MLRSFLLLVIFILASKTSFAEPIISGVDKDGVVHVSVVGLVTKPSKEPVYAAKYAMAQAFEAKNPKIKLHRAIWKNFRKVEQVKDSLGKNTPDIFYVNFRNSSAYIDAGLLYPLDEYIDEYINEVGSDELKYIIHPALDEVVRRDGPVDGDRKKKVWLIPGNPVVKALAYRKDLFVKNGLNPNNPPKNWAEMLSCAKKITNKKENIFGVFASANKVASWRFMTYLSSTGTSVLSKDKDGKWQATLAKKEAVPALRFYSELVAGLHDDGITRGFSTDEYRATKEGRVGIFFTYLGGEQILVKSMWDKNIGIAPIPAGPTGIASAEMTAPMFGIYSGQKDEIVRKAAFKWLMFTKSKEATRIKVDAFIKISGISSVNTALLDRLGMKYGNNLPNVEISKLYNELIKKSTPEPYGKNCEKIYDYLDAPVKEAISWMVKGNFDTHSDNEIDNKMLKLLKDCQLNIDSHILNR